MLVKFFATFRDVTDCKSTEISAPEDVLALLYLLSERWPGLRGKLLTADGNLLSPEAIVMVNGRHILHLQGVQTPLCETDTVAVLPVMAGG